jgi:hypothetical protein
VFAGCEAIASFVFVSTDFDSFGVVKLGFATPLLTTFDVLEFGVVGEAGAANDGGANDGIDWLGIANPDGADFSSAAEASRGGVGVDAIVGSAIVGSGATPVPTVILRLAALATVLLAPVLLAGGDDGLFAERAGAFVLLGFSEGILIRIPPTEDSDEP